jgi:hypothetical protein
MICAPSGEKFAAQKSDSVPHGIGSRQHPFKKPISH